ncbi:MAG: tetratricopeptide repeat protein, partial [Bacteroidota bacterium]
ELKSMGHFSFKNVNTPTEVLAVVEEGLVVPEGKDLEGKFTKRQSNDRNLIQSLPSWAKYGAIMLLLGLLIPISWTLFQADTVKGESPIASLDQEESTQVEVQRQSEIRSYYSFPFQDLDSLEEDAWMELGIPYALSLSHSQDSRIFNVFDQKTFKESLRGNIDEALANNCEYLLSGDFHQAKNTLQVGIKVYQTSDGRVVKEDKYVGKSFFPLMDSIAQDLKKDLGIRLSESDGVVLPLEAFMTDSELAFQKLCEGIRYRNKYPDEFGSIHELISQSLEIDSSFAWAHYYLADFHNTHHISKRVARKELELAMRHREKLPKNQELEMQIRLLNFRMLEQQKDALVLAELLHNHKPNDVSLLLNLIQEYFRQNKYEEALGGISKYRNLQNDPRALIPLESQSLIRMGDADEAEEELSEILEVDGMNGEALLWLAKTYLAQEEWDEAEKSLDRFNLLYPDFPEYTPLMEHISFMRDSSNSISSELFDSFAGTYWAAGISDRSSHKIIADNESLYFQFEGNRKLERMYALSDREYFSADGSRHVFKRNRQGEIDRMIISEAYFPDNYYWNYEIDGDILLAMDLFEGAKYEESEERLRLSLEKHPDHSFIHYYLDHLSFRKDSSYQDFQKLISRFEGNYQTEKFSYQVYREEDGLFIRSMDNIRYLDPIPLLPLSKDTFLDSHKLTFRIRFIEEAGQIIGLDFLNRSDNVTRALLQSL